MTCLIEKNNITDKLLIKLFNTRLLVVLSTLIMPFLITNFFQITVSVDPIIFYLIISTVFLSGVYIFNKAKSNPVIPYLMLQMVLLFIFLDKKILSHIGLNLKLYGAVFAISLFVAAYYLIKNFNYLWNEFSLFKYLFIYFIITGLYLLFHYYSDFRLSTDLLSLRYAQSLKVGGLGNSQTSREFGDLSQYVLFIEWLIPIISVTISLMVFKGLKTVKEINNRLIIIIKYFSIIVLTHFALSSIAFLLKFNRSIIEIGSENNPGLNYYFPLFLLLMLGFKYFLTNIKFVLNLKSVHLYLNLAILFIIIAVMMTGIQTSASSSMAIGLIFGLLMIITLLTYLNQEFPFFYSFSKNENYFNKISINQLTKTIFFIGIILLSVIYLANRIYTSFDSDAASLGMRLDHWKDVYISWIGSLDIFKFIFGYGLDSIRELIYFASNSSAVEKGIVSSHNVFLSMVYEQGLVSVFYFAAIISSVKTGINLINTKSLNINAKIFSAVNIAIVSAVFAMWLFTDMSLILKIVFFCMLGFVESAKYAYANQNKL